MISINIHTKPFHALFIGSFLIIFSLLCFLFPSREDITYVSATESLSSESYTSGNTLGAERIYSQIPIVNRYAYTTPGLLLLSINQDFTLTGSFLNFFSFPKTVFLSLSDTSGVYTSGQYVKIHTWQEYLNIFHSTQNIAKDSNGIPILNSASRIDNEGNIIIDGGITEFPSNSIINTSFTGTSQESLLNFFFPDTFLISQKLLTNTTSPVNAFISTTTSSSSSSSSSSGGGSGGGSTSNNSTGSTNTGNLTPPPPGAPTLSFTASPSSIAYNATSLLSWSSTGATSCTNNFSSSQDTAGIFITPSLTTNTLYTLSCTGIGGTASGSVTITVGSAPPPPPPPPSPINGSCGSANGTTLSSIPTASPVTNLCTSGTPTTVTGTGPWSWACTGSNGGTDSPTCTANLASNPPPPPPPGAPTLSFTASPSSIAYNATSLLSWSSTGATSCTNNFSSSQDTAGIFITPSLTTNTLYTLSCTGIGGTASGSVTITVGSAPPPPPPPPSPINGSCGSANGTTLSSIPTASPVTNLCTSGTPTTVTGTGPWSWACTGSNGGTDSPTCTANLASNPPPPPPPGAPTLSFTASPSSIAYNATSLLSWSSTGATSCTNNFSSSQDTAGIFITPSLTTNTLYTLSCTGIGGTASGSVTITVGSAPPPPPPPPSPINGSCGSANGTTLSSIPTASPVTNLCTSGTPTTVTGTGPWSWACTGSNGGTDSPTCTANLASNPPPPPPPGAPTLSFTASPSSIAYNATSLLSWSSTGATSCTNNFSSSQDTAGIFITPSLTTNTLYTLSCTGIGGTASGSVTITVGSAPPPPPPPPSPINGSCGSANGTTLSSIPTASPVTNLCTSGTPTTVTGTGPWSWACTGSNGGTDSPTCTANLASNPPPPPVSSGALSRYRNQSSLLFQGVSMGSYTSPLIAFPTPTYDYYADIWGPTYKYVDPQAGWAWRNPGGDWIDANLIPQGTTPWVSFPANAVAGSTAVYTYSGINISLLTQYVYDNSKWFTVLVEATNGARSIAGKFSPTSPSPKVYVTYTDTSTGVLESTVTARIYESMGLPITTIPSIGLTAFVEFERPIKPVASAYLSMTVTEHWSGNSNITLMLLDPPTNTEPTTNGGGLASLAGPLDQGLTSLPNILGAQRFIDGSVLSDFVVGSDSNKASEFNYDPAIWGGTQDLTKWPHTIQGKWLSNNANINNLSIVPSSYSGEGFTPIAPGLGALKISMPHFNVTDGQEVTNNGRVGADLLMMLDEPDFGRLDHIFIRYYVRLGTPYAPQVSDRKLILSSGAPRWTDMAGKMGIGPSHATSYGGVSGTSGGGYGWQMRQSWYDNEHGLGGPDEGGVTQGFHLYDFQSRNPVGHRYGSDFGAQYERWGQKGGLGSMMYAGEWYEVETELKLNTVFTGSNTYLADGELRAWVDGKLVWEGTGMVFRTLPAYDPGYDPSRLRPARELGVKELWLNWFHGGQSENTYPRTIFYSNIAWAKSRIGAMNTGTGAPPPPPPPSPINGSCGSANGTTLSSIPTASPVTNLCTSGTPTTVTGTGPWSWACTGSNGGTDSPTCTANQSAPPPSLLPIISLTASPSSIGYSETTTITWSSSGANSCTGSWGGNSLNGVYVSPALTSDMTYSLSCTGVGGVATGSIVVPVGPQNPPSWIPPEGRIGRLTTASGGLTNNFISQTAPYYEPFYTAKILNDYSTSVFNPFFGDYGAIIFQGGGHFSTNDNSVMALVLGKDSATYRRMTNPSPIFGTGTDNLTRYNNSVFNSAALMNLDLCTYNIDGQPVSVHSYGMGDVVGPENGGAPYGTFYRVGCAAGGYNGFAGAEVGHKVDFLTLSGYAQSDGLASYAWQSIGGASGSINITSGTEFGANNWSTYVPEQGRIYYEGRAASRTRPVRWYDINTGQYVVGTGSPRTNDSIGPDNGTMFYASGKNMIIFMDTSVASIVRLRYMDVSVSQPGWSSNSGVILSQNIPVGESWSTALWDPDRRKIVVGSVEGDPNAVYEIDIPTDLSAAWNVTRVPFTNGDTIPWAQWSYKRWFYHPQAKVIMYVPNVTNTIGGSDSIYIYNPN